MRSPPPLPPLCADEVVGGRIKLLVEVEEGKTVNGRVNVGGWVRGGGSSGLGELCGVAGRVWAMG